MSPRQSNIEIMRNVILTLTSCGGDSLAEEEEIDTEAMNTVGKNKTAILSLMKCLEIRPEA